MTTKLLSEIKKGPTSLKKKQQPQAPPKTLKQRALEYELGKYFVS